MLSWILKSPQSWWSTAASVAVSVAGPSCRTAAARCHYNSFVSNRLPPALSLSRLMMSSSSTSNAQNVAGKLDATKTTLLVCDVQERFAPLIYHAPTVIQTCRYMVNVAQILNVPIVVTQQYTKAFGPTVAECLAPMVLDGSDSAPVVSIPTPPIFEKKLFSMLTPEVQTHLGMNENASCSESFIVVGIEAHVCVQQTCLDLVERGKQVHLIVDGVSSQQVLDRSVALQRLASLPGVFLTTAQSAVFMLMHSADHQHFKTISKLTVQHMKLPNEFDNDAIAALQK
jgi:nicotinamidase-related amidase